MSLEEAPPSSVVLVLAGFRVAPGQRHSGETGSSGSPWHGSAPTCPKTQEVAPASVALGTCPAGTCHSPISTASPTWQDLLLELEQPSVFPAWPTAHLWGLAVCPLQARTNTPSQLDDRLPNLPGAFSCHPTLPKLLCGPLTSPAPPKALLTP